MQNVINGKILAVVRDRRGVTLPELLMVIVIMSIMIAIANASFQGATKRRMLDQEARVIASGMQQAQMRAMRENSKVIWRFDFSNDSYMAFIDIDDDGVFDAGEPTVVNDSLDTNISFVSGSELNFSSYRAIADNNGPAFDGNGEVMNFSTPRGYVNLVSNINEYACVTLTRLGAISTEMDNPPVATPSNCT